MGAGGVEPWVEVRFGPPTEQAQWNLDIPPEAKDKPAFFPIQVVIDTGTGAHVNRIIVTVDAFDDQGFPKAEPIVTTKIEQGDFTLPGGGGRPLSRSRQSQQPPPGAPNP
jgi:hypothetical protein